MDPADQSGSTGQMSPRGNDWEVVQLTASTYASAPGPPRSDHSDEEQEYGAKRDDSASAALLMSGHFSASRNEDDSLLKGDDSKEREVVPGSQYAVLDTGDDDRHEEKLKDDDLDRITSFDEGKSLPSVDVESDDANASHGQSIARENPVMFSSSGYSETMVAEKELSWSATETRTTEETTEDPILQNVDTVTDSSRIVASGEESRPDDSGPFVPRDAWWRKQIISLYKSARESNKFWPIFVAGAALMGMVYFRRRWLKGKLHLQQVKLQPASSKERINQAVAPLNRIKDILVAGNHPSPAPHGHAQLS